ncbi:hypothetical protein M8C13_04470 [Crossiella sp. SN42]|uniref:hypothetical protein n=1 Tax=Crossiella sp. SN42 TaxID=2944808 RepID=UPI00207C567B|nr:hypothetical protein [Crossiella sp. SN42]MCO1575013.1 hypothetical protein [Crossiella sp. SN42]
MNLDELAAAEAVYYQQAHHLGVDEQTARRVLDRACWDITDQRTTETDPYALALARLTGQTAAGA